MKYGYRNGDFSTPPQLIQGEYALGDALWTEPNKGFIGRSFCGLHDTPEAAKAEALRILELVSLANH